MSSTFSLSGKIGLDAKEFQQGAAKAQKSVGELADELEELPATASKAGGDAGEGLGSSIMGKIKGAGVGAAIGVAIYAGMESVFAREDATKVLEGKFGHFGQRAGELGENAANLYADNWGSSLAEVADAVGQVDQALVKTGEIGRHEVESVTESAMALADTFGTEVDQVVRSTGQLLLNDLAPSAEQAMDVLAYGLQNGANRAGDLFESIDEYSQHFAAFGLGAEDMMAIFTDGMEKGQRDTDKLADAVKEMRIRTVDDSDATREAYESIGLSADQTAMRILSGGEKARDSFVDILKRIQALRDPIEQNKVAVALLGTQFEDLGPGAIESLLAITEGLEGVEGASDRVVASFATQESGLEVLKRKATSAFGDFADSIAGVDDPMDRMFNGMDALGETTVATMDQAIAAVTPYVASAEEAQGAVHFWLQEQDALTQSLIGFHQPAQAMIDAEIRAGIEGRKAADEQERLADEIDGVGSSADTARGKVEALEARFQSLRDGMNDRSAYLSVQDGFDAVETAALEAWYAAASGAEDTEAKLRNAESAQIALKDQVLQYSEEVQNIPPEKVSSILALIDQGKLAEAEAELANLERDRTARIDINLYGTISPNLQNSPFLPYIPTPKQKGNAKGTRDWEGGLTWVGEEGPELVNLPRHSQVFTAAESVAMTAQSRSAPMSAPMDSGGPSGFANGSPLIGTFINQGGGNVVSDVSLAIRMERMS